MTVIEALISALEGELNDASELNMSDEALQRILAALAAAGFVVVPSAATEEMVAAWASSSGDNGYDEWTAMLAARPR